jgi:hypothetical protein
MSNLAEQIREALSMFAGNDTQPALIGGLAVVAHLQGFVNDATRTRDLDDIRALLKIHRASLDMDELREYFALFNKSELLNELLG